MEWRHGGHIAGSDMESGLGLQRADFTHTWWGNSIQDYDAHIHTTLHCKKKKNS